MNDPSGHRSARVAFDATLRAAVDLSNLRGLAPEVVTALLLGARRIRLSAGATLHGEGEEAPHLEMVIDGLVRVYVTAPDGRTMTIRYCRRGALMGVATLYLNAARPFAIQALIDSEVVSIRPAVVRSTAASDVRVANALLTEVSERTFSFVSEISGFAFSTVRQRMARHLLDLASEHQHDEALVARISQRELADAVGTAREVVVRCLRELRWEGAVRTTRAGIVILKPERLVGAD